MSDTTVAPSSAPAPLPWESPAPPVAEQSPVAAPGGEQQPPFNVPGETGEPTPGANVPPADQQTEQQPQPAEPAKPEPPRLTAEERRELEEARAIRAQQEQQEAARRAQEYRQQRETAINAAWEDAKAYANGIDDPERRQQYIDKAYRDLTGQLIQDADQRHQQEMAQAMAQFDQLIRIVGFAGFVEEYGAEQGLTPDEIKILKSQNDPNLVVPMTQWLKSQRSSDATSKHAAQQAFADRAAQEIKQSGVLHSGGIGGAIPVSTEYKPGTREELRPQLRSLLASRQS